MYLSSSLQKVNPYDPYTFTTAVNIFTRLADDLNILVASSSYRIFHIVDVHGITSPSYVIKNRRKEDIE